MKPFDKLTERGHMGWLLGLARAALTHYDIDVKTVRALAKHTNALFRVADAEGQRYVLRVCAPGEQLRQ